MYVFGGFIVCVKLRVCELRGGEFVLLSCLLPFGAFGALPDMMLCVGGYPVMTVTETTDPDTETTTKTAEYSCNKYVAKTCPDTFLSYEVPGAGATDMEGNCPNGMYRVRMRGGFMAHNMPATLCDNGYFDGAGCVPYAPDSTNCPDGYNKVIANTSLRVIADGTDCPSGTRSVSPYDGSVPDNKMVSVWSYPYETVPDTKLSVRLCPDGQDMNYAGDCAALCAVSNTGVSMRYLRTGNGLVFPIYAKKLTTPSLNFKSGNRHCYVNLLPERVMGTINIMRDNEYFHVVK